MSFPTRAEIRQGLLKVLYELGSARARDVYPVMTRAFPQLTEHELTERVPSGANKWTNRIQFARNDLKDAGLIDASEPGVWKLTEHGQAIAGENPNAGQLDERLKSGTTPPSFNLETDIETAPDSNPPEVFVTPLPSRWQQLSSVLIEAASDPTAPDRLERAAGDAFAFLGFEVEVIGGSGKTDVLLSAPLGVNRYRVVVDAKSTARGHVNDAQIDWLSIESHREAEAADHACIVGVAFAGGHLEQRAVDFRVSLLTARQLGELVELHSATPLTLTELRPLFTTIPHAGSALNEIRAAAQERGQRVRLLWKMFELIDNFSQLQPEIPRAKPDVLYGAVSQQRDLLGVTPDDIRRGLALLETVGIISSYKDSGGYVPETTLSGARAIIEAVVREGARASSQAETSSAPGVSSA